ncbi:MAG: hypothetical protein WCP36_02670, partial [Methanomicrobiales archaeon]
MRFLKLPGAIFLVIFFLFILCLPAGVVALESFSGDQVSIDVPVADDVFAAGGTITVNAPIDSLIAAGGTITLNAPVKGDVIVAGGRVIANNNIGGKLVAAGGTVDVNGDVGTNALITGGKVTLNPRSTIGRDAEISAGTVASSGHVAGNLSVRSQNFADTGSVGGTSTFVKTEQHNLSKIFTILGILFSIGWFLLGLVLLKIAPARYRMVEDEVVKTPVVKLVVGFVGLIVACIVLVILAITVIGLPIALVSGLLILIGIIFSVLFVSSAFGRWLLNLLKVKINDWYAFIAGFIVLSI